MRFPFFNQNNIRYLCIMKRNVIAGKFTDLRCNFRPCGVLSMGPYSVWTFCEANKLLKSSYYWAVHPAIPPWCLKWTFEQAFKGWAAIVGRANLNTVLGVKIRILNTNGPTGWWHCQGNCVLCSHLALAYPPMYLNMLKIAFAMAENLVLVGFVLYPWYVNFRFVHS